MLRNKLIFHHDVCARRAEIAGGPLVLAVAAQELNFDGHRKILVLLHALGRLTVYHDPAVSECPPRASRRLVAHEPIFEPETIVREFFLVENVAEFSAKLVVLIVTDFQDAVFHSKRVAKIVVQCIARDLDFPAVKIFAVEKADPPAFDRFLLLFRTATKSAH